MIKNLTLLFFIYFLSSCHESRYAVPVNDVSLSAEQEVVHIKNWTLLGPYHPQLAAIKNGTYIDSNYISFIDSSEEHITLEMFERACKNQSKANQFLKNDTGSYPAIDFWKGYNHAAGVIYLTAVVNVENNMDAVLLGGACQRMKIWLNNSYIYGTGFKHNQSKFYEEYVPVKLKKGANFILVKVGVEDLSSSVTYWKLNLNIATVPYAKSNFLKDYRFDFIKGANVNNGEVQFYAGPYINDTAIEYSLFDMTERLVLQGRPIRKKEYMPGWLGFKMDDSLCGKLTTVKLKFVESEFRQDILYGNMFEEFRKIEGLYASKVKSIRDSNEVLKLDAGFLRLQYLMRVYMTGKDHIVRYWDRSRVWFAKELLLFFQGITSGFNGLIHGYKSQIDDSKQYYLFHMNKELVKQGKKVPLLIIMPFPTKNDAPFLKSWFISNWDQNLWDIKLADEAGFALMWVNLRGNPGTNAIAVQDFLESLEHVKKYYPIDTSRVFLLGNSAAVPKTMLMAARLPVVVAGCALINPVINKTRNLLQDVARNEPANYIRSLQNSHIFIKGSIFDEVVNIDSVKSFYNTYKNVIPLSHLVIAKSGSHYNAPKDYYKDVFQFFKDKVRIDGVQGKAQIAVNARHLENAFASRFLLVYGKQSESTALTFVAKWRSKYFVDCLAKRDDQISSKDIEQSNLILIGNESTNKFINHLTKKNIIRLSGDSVLCNGKTFYGKNLVLYAALPNPFNPARQCVVIGANQLSKYLPLADPANDALYDYMVFQHVNDSAFSRQVTGYWD
jgi:hypothetical protein